MSEGTGVPAQQPTLVVATRLAPQSTWWVLFSTAITGLTTYVLLVVTARAVGPESYGDFGVFWAITVIAGLGIFLPLEQETTRRGAGIAAAGAGLGSLWRRSTRVAVLAAAGAGLAISGLSVISGRVVADQRIIIIIFAVACAGYCLQFPARGVLAATRRFRGYATVVIVESLVRAVVAIVLWAFGETSVWLFAAAVGGSALLAGVVGVALIRRDGSTGGGQPVTDFGRDSARLVVAASSMQTLLNSGTLVAKFLSMPAQAMVAGQLLAVMTIARLPVVVFQSLQSVYVSRLARGWHLRDVPGVRHLLGMLALLAGLLATLLVAGAALIGTFVTKLIFGPDYLIDRTTCVLVALGVGVYLVASVASDSSIAVGMHTLIVSAWVAGLMVGVVVAILAPTLLTKATVPLIAGASLACVVLVVALVARTRRIAKQ